MRWSLVVNCSIALMALSFSVPTQATTMLADAGELAQMSLDDLLHVEVQSASRYAQPLADSPASVTVIDQEELHRQSYRNLAEALSSMPGVYVSNDRDYSYLGVRGFNRPGDYNSRILLLTDGARRNDALYDQAQIGNESPIEIDWVKRLEFVSGPASAVYGANAVFGIVNAVMLDGGDINGTRLTLDTGSGHSSRLGLLAGQRVDSEHEWFFALAAYGARGNDLYFPEFDNGTSNGWARGLDGEEYQKAYGKFRFGNWRLSANLSSRDKNLPNAPFLTAFGEPGTHTVDHHALIQLDGKVLKGKPLKLVHVNAADIAGCQTLYVSPDDAASLPRIVSNLRSSSILLVGDSPGYLRRGVMLNLDIDGGRIVFDIDLRSVSSSTASGIQRIRPRWRVQ